MNIRSIVWRLFGRACSLATIASIAVSVPIFSAKAQNTFEVNPPGKLLLNNGSGVADTKLYAPKMLFPIKPGNPATPRSQVASPGGGVHAKANGNKWGDQCDKINFNENWWDTLCENRSKSRKKPLGCKKNAVHQGIDINAGTAQQCLAMQAKQKWRKVGGKLVQVHPDPKFGNNRHSVPVIAVADGTVTAVGNSMTVDLTLTDGSAKFRYLHLNMKDAKERWPRREMDVNAGDLIGYIWNDFGGSPTPFHLHFEHWKTIQGKGHRPVPLYCDLVRAYENDHKKSPNWKGQPQCATRDGQPVIVQQPQDIPETGSLSDVKSVWRAEILQSDGTSRPTEHGLIVTGKTGRVFIVTDTNVDPLQALPQGTIVFQGTTNGSSYSGTYRRFQKGCEPQLVTVNGTIASDPLAVILTGDAAVLDGDCKDTGATQTISVAFDFDRKIEGGSVDQQPAGPKVTKDDLKIMIARLAREQRLLCDMLNFKNNPNCGSSLAGAAGRSGGRSAGGSAVPDTSSKEDPKLKQSLRRLSNKLSEMIANEKERSQ